MSLTTDEVIEICKLFAEKEGLIVESAKENRVGKAVNDVGDLVKNQLQRHFGPLGGILGGLIFSFAVRRAAKAVTGRPAISFDAKNKTVTDILRGLTMQQRSRLADDVRRAVSRHQEYSEVAVINFDIFYQFACMAPGVKNLIIEQVRQFFKSELGLNVK